MSLDKNYWTELAADYVTAGPYRTKRALILAMAVAEHETCSSRAWPGTWNFGAVQLRTLTSAERDAFKSGTLKAGSTYPGNPGGVLHVDTHPTPQGPVPYPVWFATFPDRVSGIAYFLRVLDKLSNGAATKPDAWAGSLAEAMYLRGYYEGAHAGARPLGQRVAPYNAGEAANISDYTLAVTRCLTAIVPQLPADWQAEDPRQPPTPPPGPGQEAGEAGEDEGLPGNAHTDLTAVSVASAVAAPRNAVVLRLVEALLSALKSIVNRLSSVLRIRSSV